MPIILTMNEREALQYIKENEGSLTKDDFIKAHHPLGSVLWNVLYSANTIFTHNEKVYITLLGEALLKYENLLKESILNLGGA